MTDQVKKKIFATLSILMLFAAIYCALGILQAASIFTGERALRDLHFWGTLMCIAFACSVFLGFLALRARKLEKGGSRDAM